MQNKSTTPKRILVLQGQEKRRQEFLEKTKDLDPIINAGSYSMRFSEIEEQESWRRKQE